MPYRTGFPPHPHGRNSVYHDRSDSERGTPVPSFTLPPSAANSGRGSLNASSTERDNSGVLQDETTKSRKNKKQISDLQDELKEQEQYITKLQTLLQNSEQSLNEQKQDSIASRIRISELEKIEIGLQTQVERRDQTITAITEQLKELQHTIDKQNQAAIIAQEKAAHQEKTITLLESQCRKLNQTTSTLTHIVERQTEASIEIHTKTMETFQEQAKELRLAFQEQAKTYLEFSSGMCEAFANSSHRQQPQTDMSHRTNNVSVLSHNRVGVNSSGAQ
jgi:chromosome segregation ATPase